MTSIAFTTALFISLSLAFPADFTYKGCYVDNVSGRVLPHQRPDSDTLTIDSCITTCVGLGYSIAGAEYSRQCFCGNAIYNGGALASADTECNMNCAGDASQKCGDGNRLSVYSNTTITEYQPAKAQTTGLPGSWSYLGCYRYTDPRLSPTFLDSRIHKRRS